MLAGARMLDYIGLKYLYASEINILWKQLGAKTGSNDLSVLTAREINLLFRYKTNDILEIILQMKDLFREAWLNEYNPFHVDVPLGRFDVEFQFWLRLQRCLLNPVYRNRDTMPALESLVSL